MQLRPIIKIDKIHWRECIKKFCRKQIDNLGEDFLEIFNKFYFCCKHFFISSK